MLILPNMFKNQSSSLAF